MKNCNAEKDADGKRAMLHCW